MPEPEPFTNLGLNKPPPPPQTKREEALPAPETLQFRIAEPVPEAQPDSASSYTCAACKRPITSTYFQGPNVVVCPECTATIARRQKTPPLPVLVKSILYGLGAAVAGSVLYAVVLINVGQFALVAILIGYMVGKAIRYGAGGLGSRPQQVAAILLTYFAVTVGIVPVVLYRMSQKVVVTESPSPAPQDSQARMAHQRPAFPPAVVLLRVTVGALAYPIFGLKAGLNGIFSLVIILFALLRAWQMTRSTQIILAGPHSVVL